MSTDLIGSGIDQRTLTFQFVPQRQLIQPRANG